MPATATRPLIKFTEAQLRARRSSTRLKQWIEAGRLRPAMVDERGHHWYDPVDVDRVAAESRRRAEIMLSMRASEGVADEISATPPRPPAPAATPASHHDALIVDLLRRIGSATEDH